MQSLILSAWNQAFIVSKEAKNLFLNNSSIIFPEAFSHFSGPAS